MTMKNDAGVLCIGVIIEAKRFSEYSISANMIKRHGLMKQMEYMRT